MQVNSVSNYTFGLNPTMTTKYLLFQMESNNIDTKPLMNLMNEIYVGKDLVTHVLPGSGKIVTVISDKGDQGGFQPIISAKDDVFIKVGSGACANPKRLYEKLLSGLMREKANRDGRTLILDKINSTLKEKHVTDDKIRI